MNIVILTMCRSTSALSSFSAKNNFRSLGLFVRSPVMKPFSSHCNVQRRLIMQQLCVPLKSYASCVQNDRSLLFCNQVCKFSCGRVLLSHSPLIVNTNVVKDVILFRYDNSKFYTILNIFAVCQFLFWMYLSQFAFTSLKDTPVNRENEDELPWWRKINLGENKYRNGIAFICFFIGYGVLASAWAFTLRSVRFLILRKGGEGLTFVTYGPFGKNRMMTVPLSVVSCEQARHAARVQLPIKVKGKYLFYILDMRGEFTNPHLFDVTAGLKRT